MSVKLQAPPGKFRVIGVDTFDRDPDESLLGECNHRAEAIRAGVDKGGQMYKTYVYDDMGRMISEGGSF